jgi:hypothetical protein
MDSQINPFNQDLLMDNQINPFNQDLLMDNQISLFNQYLFMVSLNKINTANLYLNTGKLNLIMVNLNID